jgi:flagellar L-ring protein FlgH
MKFLNSILILTFAISLNASSLWISSNPYGDNNAHKIGDIITILIQETSIGSSKTNNQRGKQVGIGGTSGADEDNSTFLNSFAKLIPLFGANVSGKSDYKANIDGQKSNQLIATISAIVTEITPEGNLLLEGVKNVRINKEEQNIIIKGLARPSDISSDNKIISDKIANAEIVYTGDLAEMEKDKRPGILRRTYNSVFGFLF